MSVAPLARRRHATQERADLNLQRIVRWLNLSMGLGGELMSHTDEWVVTEHHKPEEEVTESIAEAPEFALTAGEKGALSSGFKPKFKKRSSKAVM